MPNKNKYVAGWRTAYTTPPIDTTSSHQPAAPSDKRETSTSPESPQDTQPPYPGMGKATIDVEPCPHLQALRAAKEARERKVWKKRAEEKVKGGGKYMKRIRRTHESIEYELSKGHTRDCPTSEELASWSDVCSPYHLYTKAVYVDNPYTLNFPERMCGALAKTFILSKEYDAQEHTFRFISGVSHNKLYGWTMGGTCRVRITYNTGDPMRYKVELLP